MQHFVVLQIYYTPELEQQEQEPIQESTLVIYQYRSGSAFGGDPTEDDIERDARQKISGLQPSDLVKIRGRITDPIALQVLKRWNKRCIDEGAGLFVEGTIDSVDS